MLSLTTQRYDNYKGTRKKGSKTFCDVFAKVFVIRELAIFPSTCQDHAACRRWLPLASGSGDLGIHFRRVAFTENLNMARCVACIGNEPRCSCLVDLNRMSAPDGFCIFLPELYAKKHRQSLASENSFFFWHCRLHKSDQ